MNLPLEFWTTRGLSLAASGVGKPLYADRVTEEQQRLGFARVLVEIDTKSVCPKEIHIRRANGTIISIGVEYPWLPPKCSGCGKFGHVSYACATNKKDKKIWVPKRKETTVVKPQKTTKVFDRAISRPAVGTIRKSPIAARTSPEATCKSPGRKPPVPTRRFPVSSPSKAHTRRQGDRMSNSFGAFGSNDVEDEMEDQIAPRTPTTFLEVFENVLSSRDKGKRVMGNQGDGAFVERGFSPTH
jgi:hypothetical protein